MAPQEPLVGKLRTSPVPVSVKGFVAIPPTFGKLQLMGAPLMVGFCVPKSIEPEAAWRTAGTTQLCAWAENTKPEGQSQVCV